MSGGIAYYVIDTETTGIMVGHAEMCEYSIVRCSDKTQLSRQIKVDKPLNANADALLITGKTIDDLRKGITKQQAIQDFNEFVERDGLTPAHRCVVAHNAQFDKRFLHHFWKQQNQSFPMDLWLCTLQLSKRMATKIGQPKAKVKLEMAMDLFGIKKLGGSHTAKGDARNTYLLWKHFMESNIEYLDLIKQFPHRQIEVSNDNMEDFE